MDAALRLRAVGRAGVGVDNIDVAAATTRGVVVMNAPDGNTITTAEHTIAMLIALARRVPQANASLKAGRWERKRFIGVELRGKTLGIVGLGRIGRVVASRARNFGMNIIAFDPFIAPEQARDLELETAHARRSLRPRRFPDGSHAAYFRDARDHRRCCVRAMKQGVRIINCARGGLVDERALLSAIKEGTVAGAALDVFEEEPPPAGSSSARTGRSDRHAASGRIDERGAGGRRADCGRTDARLSFDGSAARGCQRPGARTRRS